MDVRRGSSTVAGVTQEVWAVGEAYEGYVGRWSRRVAEEFLRRLDVPAARRWLDVGCGTGALTAAVLARCRPAEVVGVDPSPGFLAHARAGTPDPRVTFQVGDAGSLPAPDRSFDAVVSGLALNFVADADAAAAEFVRVADVGAVVAAYVWDYADGMAMMRHFWQAAADIDPTAAERNEGSRFPLCRPEPLRRLWTGAGLDRVAVEAIEVPTVFRDFDDYWRPFLGGQGPGPAYVVSLPEEHRRQLRELLRSRLPVDPDGAIRLTARAWAVQGTSS